MRLILVSVGVLAILFGSVARLARAAVDPYPIYAILSLSGPLALLGNDEKASLEIVEGVVNRDGGIGGRPIHFVIQDDLSQAPVAVQLVNAIIAKGAPVLLGPTYAASCLAIAPLIKVAGPMTYCLSPAIHPVPGSLMFSASVSTLDQAAAWFNFALSRGWKRIAVLSSTDSAGQDADIQIAATLSKPQYSSIEIVDREHFALSDVSVAAQAEKIKSQHPDAIIVTCVGAPTGTALRGLKEAGLEKTPVITSFGNLIHAQLKQYASFLPEHLYLTAPRFVSYDVSRSGPVRDAQHGFYNAFEAAHLEADAPHNLGWDPAFLVVAALRTLGTSATPGAIAHYLETLHGYAGTIGIYDYRDGSQRGVGLSSVVVVQWNVAKGTWSTVSDTGGRPLR
jgi:branched-chain amino acid transport system substrate-binding protein